MITMKLNRIVISSILLMSGTACSHEEVFYETPDCHLNFYYEYENSEQVTEEYSTTFYSFVYAGDEATADTLWFEVSTMGFLSAEDRPFVMKQLPVEGADNAVSGVHYVAFDAAEVAGFYRIPARQNKVRIPVILLRNDPELQTKARVLRFGFGENAFFTPGYESLAFRTIHISDYLTKPANWWRIYMGSYGQVKHRLMIQWTGKPWDEAYIQEYSRGDAAYRTYMQQWLRRKLGEENARRLADPAIGDVYREADGTAVAF